MSDVLLQLNENIIQSVKQISVSSDATGILLHLQINIKSSSDVGVDSNNSFRRLAVPAPDINVGSVEAVLTSNPGRDSSDLTIKAVVKTKVPLSGGDFIRENTNIHKE